MSSDLSRAELVDINLALHMAKTAIQIPEHTDCTEALQACTKAALSIERSLEIYKYQANLKINPETLSWLFHRFKNITVPVKSSVDLFYVSYKTALARINAGTWPVRTFKTIDSANAPLQMHLYDIAAHIDNERYKSELRQKPNDLISQAEIA